MKKLSFFLLAFFTVLFFSCKKDSSSSGSSSNYYIKATVGGTQKNYTSNPLVTIINQSNIYSMSLSAGAGGTSLEGLALQITQNNTPILAGTYLESGTTYTIAGDYNPGSTDVSAIFGAGLNPLSAQPLQITISQLSDKIVSGTFSGEFYSNSGVGSDSLLVANGSFNLPIK